MRYLICTALFISTTLFACNTPVEPDPIAMEPDLLRIDDISGKWIRIKGVTESRLWIRPDSTFSATIEALGPVMGRVEVFGDAHIITFHPKRYCDDMLASYSVIHYGREMELRRQPQGCRLGLTGKWQRY